MPKIRILACACSISHVGFAEAFSKEKDFTLIKRICSGEDIIPYARKMRPDILLLCFYFLMDKGSNLITELKEKIGNSKIVVFNSSLVLEQELKMVKQGIVGILSSDTSPKTLVRALKRVQAGEVWLGRKLIKPLMVPHPNQLEVESIGNGNSPLTGRESEILAMIAAGYRNQEISSEFNIAEGTVKTHINKIYKKLEVKDRLQATFYAIKHGIISSNSLPQNIADNLKK